MSKAKTTNPDSAAAKASTIEYCPMTNLAGRDIENRPARYIPYPAPVTVETKDVIVFKAVGQYSSDGEELTYAVPLMDVAKKCTTLSRPVKAVKIG